LALTGGNSDTTSYNIAFDVLRDPNTRNSMKASGLYLRGDSDGEAIVDRLNLGFRDEYTLSERTFLYGDLAYLRDKFKLIDYLFSPSGGVGYKVYNTDQLLFSLQGGVGAVWEKNPGFDVNSSGAVTAGQDLSWKLSEAARIVQNFTALWKTEEFEDALYHFGLGLATSITKNSELKVEFRDDFKNLPATPETKKNDTAFVTTFLFKF
jgi:putative salt-induced outer membrane protein